jgi:2-methylcitrate dehydratase PrpD
MSAPVAAALAVVDGVLAAHHFLPESIKRPQVQRLVELCNTVLDEECERIYPGRRSGYVRIDLVDGRSLDRRVLDPKGEGVNPMSDEDLERKFFVNCEPVIGKATCERLHETIWGFESASNLRELFTLL